MSGGSLGRNGRKGGNCKVIYGKGFSVEGRVWFFEFFCFVFRFDGTGLGMGHSEDERGSQWRKLIFYLYLKQSRMDLMSSYSVHHFCLIFNLNKVLIKPTISSLFSHFILYGDP